MRFIDERTDYENQIRQLEGRISELEEDEMNTTRTQERRGTTNWRDKYYQLQKQMDANMSELRGQFEKTKKAEIDAMLKQYHSQSQNEINTLQARLTSYEDLMRETNDKSTKMSELLRSVKKELKAREEENQELRDELESMEQNNQNGDAELQQEIQALKDEQKTLKDEQKALKDQNKKYRHDLKNKELEIKDLKVQAEISVSSARQELEEFRKQYKEEIDELTQQHKQQVDEYKKQYKLEVSRRKSENVQRETIEKNNQYVEGIEQLRERQTELEGQVKKLTKELSETVVKVNSPPKHEQNDRSSHHTPSRKSSRSNHDEVEFFPLIFLILIFQTSASAQKAADELKIAYQQLEREFYSIRNRFDMITKELNDV